MSAHHLTPQQIYDRVDGWQDPETERHLAECVPCRRRLEEVERLLESMAALPEEVDPPEWIWIGLLDRVRAEAAKEASAPHKTVRRIPRLLRISRRGLYRAAAVLVLAAAVGVGLRLRREGSHAPAPAGMALADDASFRASLEVYERATAALARTFDERASELPPGTREALAQSLGDLDRAIAGVRKALTEQPGHPRLQARLSRTYQWKVKVLERAVRMTTEM